MPLYEHVFLARQDISTQQVEGLVQEFRTIIEGQGGTIGKTEYWGLKGLTFRIKKNRKAHFSLMNIDAPPAAVTELERQMRLSTDILRFLTVRVDEHEAGPSPMAANAYRRDGGLSGLATGFTDLDGKMGGLQPSDLIIVAGRPSMGKTALATNIAYHVAQSYRRDPDSQAPLDGAVVGFFSLEMSAEQLATRIISEQAYIPSERIRRGRIESEEFDRIVEVSQELQNLPLYIDQTGGITVAQLAARARRLKRQRDVGLIVVDYLQLLSGSTRRAAEGRVQEVSEITTGLKALAKELHVPVLALSQLSRQVEQREDKRPQLADLRESGSIEQDADVVLFVFREEYYVERRQPRENTEEHKQWQQEMDLVTGKAEVIIGKQRHGPTGTVRLQFTPEFTRFGNLAAEERLPERLD